VRLEQSLYAKESKCEIGMTEVLYLGHIIEAKGVQVHQEKIQAIMEWPLRHVDQILSIMEEQSLYAKESKCEIGMTEVLYLGHIIEAKGVQVHQEKIQAIMEWPILRHS
jgi:hypothetical protein